MVVMMVGHIVDCQLGILTLSFYTPLPPLPRLPRKQVVGRKKQDMAEMLEELGIHVENPCVILDQVRVLMVGVDCWCC